MMPLKEILAMQPKEPKPPVLVIDETTIKCSDDAGPVCGCHEKYDTVQSYKPFLPGGIHPYKRRTIPENECFELAWKKVRIGSCGYNLEKPVAVHLSELPENYMRALDNKTENFWLVRLPQYDTEYFEKNCKREHLRGCTCPTK